MYENTSVNIQELNKKTVAINYLSEGHPNVNVAD